MAMNIEYGMIRYIHGICGDTINFEKLKHGYNMDMTIIICVCVCVCGHMHRYTCNTQCTYTDKIKIRLDIYKYINNDQTILIV